jgi:hypothetical protein
MCTCGHFVVTGKDQVVMESFDKPVAVSESSLQYGKD